jgi:hypothetical protein
MGIRSRVRSIDERVLQPKEPARAARRWWVLLVTAVATFVLTTLVLLALAEDLRFLIPLATAAFTVPVAFQAGFQFNNHLRATGRDRGGWPEQRVLR